MTRNMFLLQTSWKIQNTYCPL